MRFKKNRQQLMEKKSCCLTSNLKINLPPTHPGKGASERDDVARSDTKMQQKKYPIVETSVGHRISNLNREWALSNLDNCS